VREELHPMGVELLHLPGIRSFEDTLIHIFFRPPMLQDRGERGRLI